MSPLKVGDPAPDFELPAIIVADGCVDAEKVVRLTVERRRRKQRRDLFGDRTDTAHRDHIARERRMRLWVDNRDGLVGIIDHAREITRYFRGGRHRQLHHRVGLRRVELK